MNVVRDKNALEKESILSLKLSQGKNIKASPKPPLSESESKLSPDELNAIYYAAKRADTMGDKKLAVKHLTTLRVHSPLDFRVVRRLSRIAVDSGRIAQGRQVLEESLLTQEGGENAWLWQGLGNLEQRVGDINKARLCYRKALELDNSLANVYHSWSRLESSQNNIRRAALILKRGVQAVPDNHRLHHAFGDLHLTVGDYDAAEISLRKGLKIAPTYQKSFMLSSLGVLEFSRGNVELARAYFTDSIKRNKRHAQAWLSLALLEEKDGKNDVARATYERAAKNFAFFDDKKNADGRNAQPLGSKWVHVFQSWARFEQVAMKDIDAATAVYSQSTLIFPNDWKLWLNWGKLESTANRELKARAILERAIKVCQGRSGDPYRAAAELEMDMQQYERARALYGLGSEAVRKQLEKNKNSKINSKTFQIKDVIGIDSAADDESVNIDVNGLAPLLHGWAHTEWQLNNIKRARKLFALALSNVSNPAFEAEIYISLSQFEKKNNVHLAHHYCCRSIVKGGGITAWKLWGGIGEQLGNDVLADECYAVADRLYCERLYSDGERIGGSDNKYAIKRDGDRDEIDKSLATRWSIPF